MARPEFEPTAEQRNAVAIAAGGGMTHEEIAVGLGISTPTLRKHFERELAESANLKRMEVYAALHGAALKGNAAAAREYLRGEPVAATQPEPDKPEAPKGKKEQANEDAKTAHRGTKWAGLLDAPKRTQ